MDPKLGSPPNDNLDPNSAARGYESRDLPRGSMLISTVGLAMVGAIVFALLFWLHRALFSHPIPEAVGNSVVSEMDVPSGRTLPPLLPEDVKLLHAHENVVFHQLGWSVDDRSPHASIPDSIVTAVAQREKH